MMWRECSAMVGYEIGMNWDERLKQRRELKNDVSLLDGNHTARRDFKVPDFDGFDQIVREK